MCWQNGFTYLGHNPSDNAGTASLFFRGIKVEDKEFVSTIKFPFLTIAVSILTGDAEKTLVVNRQKVVNKYTESIRSQIRNGILDLFYKIYEVYFTDDFIQTRKSIFRDFAQI